MADHDAPKGEVASETTAKLTHVDTAGRARMVDVSPKAKTDRVARALGRVVMAPDTMNAIRGGTIKKGAVLATVRIAGIMAAKRTSDLIPLCHPLALNSVTVDFEERSDTELEICAEVRCHGRTGVEMEALTAVSAAALTLYDMCKAIDRTMEIASVKLMHKSGGKSGTFDRTIDLGDESR